MTRMVFITDIDSPHFYSILVLRLMSGEATAWGVAGEHY